MTTAGVSVRDAHATAHPLCEHCVAVGRVTPVQDVGHAIPLERDGVAHILHGCYPSYRYAVLAQRMSRGVSVPDAHASGGHNAC